MKLRPPSVEERIFALIEDTSISCGSIVSMILLLKNINATGKNKETFLMKSIYCGRADIAYNLIKNGADVTLADKYKNTALHYAISSELSDEEKINLITELIAHDADINIKNRYGKTPLMLAEAHNQFKIIELLLEAVE